jgi:hypothetical protein
LGIQPAEGNKKSDGKQNRPHELESNPSPATFKCRASLPDPPTGAWKNAEVLPARSSRPSFARDICSDKS